MRRWRRKNICIVLSSTCETWHGLPCSEKTRPRCVHAPPCACRPLLCPSRGPPCAGTPRACSAPAPPGSDIPGTCWARVLPCVGTPRTGSAHGQLCCGRRPTWIWLRVRIIRISQRLSPISYLLVIILHWVKVVVLRVSAFSISRDWAPGGAWVRAGVSTGSSVCVGRHNTASTGSTGRTRPTWTTWRIASRGVGSRSRARRSWVTHLVRLLFLLSSFDILITLSSRTLLGCCAVRYRGKRKNPVFSVL